MSKLSPDLGVRANYEKGKVMRWNLSTKLVTAYSALIALTAGMLSILIYWQIQSSQKLSLKHHLEGTVSLAAHQINSDYHALTNSPEDKRKFFYRKNQQQLKNIQSSDSNILRLYTLRFQNGKYRIVLNYAPEFENSPELRLQVGAIPAYLPPMLQHRHSIEHPLTETKITINRNGKSVLYGYAPIQSKSEQMDGILVIEMDATSVNKSTRFAILTASGIFGAVLLISVPLVWWLSRSLVVRPILQLNRVTSILAEGNWHEVLPTDREDELGQLAVSFNNMTRILNSSFKKLQDNSHNLERSEARAKASFEQAAVGIAESDLQTGKITKANNRFCEMLGYSQAELIKLSIRDVTYIEDIANTKKYIQQLYSGDIDNFTVEKRYIRRDKSVFWAASTVSLIDIPGENAKSNLAIIQDISDRKLAEDNLRASEKRFRRAIEGAPFPIMIHAEDGEVLQISSTWTELTGYSHTDIPTTTAWAKLAYGDDAAKVIREVMAKKYTLTSRWEEGEFSIKTRKGDQCQWEFSSAPLGALPDGRRTVISMAVDVTQRRQSEKELYQSKQLLQIVLDTIPQLVLWKDRNSNYLGCNQAFANLVGLSSSAEIIGKNDFELPGKREEADFYLECDRRVMTSGQAELGIINTQMTSEGKEIYFEANTSPLLDAEDNAIGILRTIHDITIQKEAEKTLKQINEELEERVKERTSALEQANVEAELAKEKANAANKAKSSFLANMSHELRTPLNGILGYAHILRQDNDALTAKQSKGLNIIYKSGDHLLTLINDILDHAKIEAGKLELLPTDIYLQNFLQEIVDMMTMQAQAKNINFQCLVESSLPISIYADAKRLRQTLLNLLSNAVKFTDRGEVTFKVKTGSATSENIKMPQVQKTVSFIVQDSGIGMNPEQLTQIFNPFEQVGNKQRQSAGTGLGLNITKQLVEKMGGNLQVASELGKGSTFWFEVVLPCSEKVNSNDEISKSSSRTKINQENQSKKLEVERNQTLVVPPKEEMENLYELAMLGSMKKIKEQATYLEELDEQYAPLAAELKELAEGFQEKEIVSLIEQYL